jgi:hypothetical protein
MSHQNSDPTNDSNLRQRASSRWENEGGALPGGPETSAHVGEHIPVPEMTNVQLVALHVRVIALENLVISLLATASNQQLDLVREMARYISPRPGFTPHPLTVRGAAHMIDLLERSSRFHSGCA